MGFGKNHFKPGGKKGPRQLGHTFKTTAKLLPPPAAVPRSDRHLDRAGHNSDDDSGLSDSGSDSEPEIGRNVPVLLPLIGVTVTVTGCRDRKPGLLEIAAQLGATVQPSLTDSTTHLVADEAGSAKYEVRYPSLLCPFFLKCAP